MRSKKLAFKVLLLIDNAPGHVLIEHENVKVMFLPPNTTSLIQPLDQGIIAAFKSNYVKHSFQYILEEIESNGESNVISAWKMFDLKECIQCIKCALKDLNKSTLNNCWKNLWKDAVVTEDNEIDRLSAYADIFQLATTIGGESFQDMNIEDMNEYFENPLLNDE